MNARPITDLVEHQAASCNVIGLSRDRVLLCVSLGLDAASPKNNISK